MAHSKHSKQTLRAILKHLTNLTTVTLTMTVITLTAKTLTMTEAEKNN